ncbi:hypothetical protein [Aestuariivirga sp.]|jgi:hypothetical protein|uniref:hypothetical protein n=1 Tax=Aestuariivirga sp. TaxID=2650926 RepID=UPI0037834DF4
MKVLAVSIFMAVDFLLIGTHITLWMLGVRVPLFSIEIDRSYPEFYQYLKFFWLFYLSIVLAIRRGEAAFVFLAIIFLALLVVDSFGIHESFGSKIASTLTLEPILGLRLQEYGEMFVMASLGASSFLLWGIAYSLARADQRYIIVFTGKMLLLLALFGVVVDMVHQMMTRVGRTAYFIAGSIEDGGEMLVLSVLAGFFVVYSLSSNRMAPLANFPKGSLGTPP